MIETCFSPLYAETNSMYTLYNTREVLGDDDFLLLESDLIFEPKAIRSLLDCAFSDVMLITPVTKFPGPVLCGVRFGAYSHQLFCQ